MVSNEVYFVHPKKGVRVTAPVGYSWTTLFFGPFPMMFRKKILWFFGILLLSYFTLGIANIVLGFFINKFYIKSLISDGFEIEGVKHGSVEELSPLLGIFIPVAAAAAAALVATQDSDANSDASASNSGIAPNAVTDMAKDLVEEVALNTIEEVALNTISSNIPHEEEQEEEEEK
jgi:hypothetical protein